MRKVIVAGHICLDITPVFHTGKSFGSLDEILIPGKLLQMDEADVHTGGAVANTGLAFKKLGADVKLLGKVGDDDFGKLVKEIIRSYGAGGLITDSGCSTSYSVVIAVPGVDIVFLHHPGANDSFKCDDIPDSALEGAELFHFGYSASLTLKNRKIIKEDRFPYRVWSRS